MWLMGEIDHDPPRVQARHDLMAEAGEAAVVRRHAAIAELVGGIVGELDDADAQIGEGIYPPWVVTHLGRILEAVDDADLVPRPRPKDAVGGVDLGELVGARGDDPIPCSDRRQRILERVDRPGDVAERDVDGAETRSPGVGDRPVIDIRGRGVRHVRVGPKERQIRIFQSAQGVDDQHRRSIPDRGWRLEVGSPFANMGLRA